MNLNKIIDKIAAMPVDNIPVNPNDINFIEEEKQGTRVLTDSDKERTASELESEFRAINKHLDEIKKHFTFIRNRLASNPDNPAIDKTFEAVEKAWHAAIDLRDWNNAAWGLFNDATE